MTLRRFLDPFRLLRGREREGLEAARARKPLIVVGLGNPGPRYRGTRHNVGAVCIDELARRAGVQLSNRVREAEVAESDLAGARAVLARPVVYVNESGRAVRNVMKRFNAGPDRLLVIVDDMNLALGKVRLRPGGSAGGHNGLKSVSSVVGTNEYARLRIGIGRPQPGQDPVDHVLGRFRPDERNAIQEAVVRAADAVEAVQRVGVQDAMNEFNG